MKVVLIYYLQKNVVNNVLGGDYGFGANSKEIKILLKDVLNSWGQYPTLHEYMKNMFSLTREEMESAGILTDYFNQVDLIEDFAKEASDALRSIDYAKSQQAEMDLVKKLNDCGDFTSKINSLEQWIELMGVTGIWHGCTLSYSRYFATDYVMKWNTLNENNNDDEVWSEADSSLISTLGIILPVDIGRHVMSKWKGTFHPKLQVVLDKYDALSTKLKEEYQEKLLENNNEDDDDEYYYFNNFGFLLTDYCTDGFDGKQLTSATYN